MTGAGASTPHKAGTGILLSLVLFALLIPVPAAAATKYLGGSPAFSASVSGVNEFLPGDEADITILLRNTGLSEAKQLNRGTIEPEDLPTTAKTVTTDLASPDDVIIVKTDTQMIGDIPGDGKAVPLTFTVKISTSATDGEYILPLTLRYRYPEVRDQEKADVYAFTYRDEKVTLPITIRIHSQVRIEILEAEPENLSAGSTGYLNLTIRNAGPENGKMAVVKLLRSGRSPVIPAENSVFIGSFPAGGVVHSRYKVSVSPDAMNQSYPVDVAVSYTNREGSLVTTSRETAGIPIIDKPSFTVMSKIPRIPTGADQTITIVYRNNGNIPVYAAEVRITPHEPIIMEDTTAFIGTVAPSGTAQAVYRIHAGAGTGTYTFDSIVRFRDGFGYSSESDTVPVQIEINPAESGLFGGGLVLWTAFGALICITIFVLRKRGENR